MIDSIQDNQIITQIITQYFDATYYGNRLQLKQIFHPTARISGSINGEFYDLSLAEFISRVTNKPTAADKNDPYDKHILLIDRNEDAAIVIASAKVSGIHFTDYLSLLKIDNKWVIKNKCFTTNK